jgi:hypothetical protein
MASGTLSIRVFVILGVLLVSFYVAARWQYQEVISPKLLLAASILATVPIGMALQAVDRRVSRSRTLRNWPTWAKTLLVVQAGICLAALLAWLGYGLGELAGLHDEAPWARPRSL